MGRMRFVLIAVAALASTIAATAPSSRPADEAARAIDAGRLPDGYRDWTLIAPAQEAAPLNELRAVVGNRKAVKAYRAGAQAFPDGTVLVKLAWRHEPSPDFAPASIPGAATTVQVMVKDSKRYAASGGWGFGRFIDGKPVDQAQHQTCFACHAARVADRDYVFTRYAP